MNSLPNTHKKKSRSRRSKKNTNTTPYPNTSTKSISLKQPETSKSSVSDKKIHKKTRSRRKRNKTKSKTHTTSLILSNKNDTIPTDTNVNIEYSDCKISETILQQTTNKKLPPPKIKATGKNYIVIQETPKIFNFVTLPFISKWKNDNTQQWIHQLSLHQKQDEKHLKLYNNKHFIAYIRTSWIKSETHCNPKEFPNPNQWGKPSLTDSTHLRIMAIVNRDKYPELITLRDIRGKHYKLLYDIKMTLCQQIEEIYGVKMSELKIYVHYRPTALLFHIHFVHVNNYKKHTQSFRDHFIDDILENICERPNFYRDTTLKHQIYFDRPKSITFAKHTKCLMNMKGIHKWYDKPDNKRVINQSIPEIMPEKDENKMVYKPKNVYVVNKSNPSTMRYVNKSKQTGILNRNNILKRPEKIQNRFARNILKRPE